MLCAATWRVSATVDRALLAWDPQKMSVSCCWDEVIGPSGDACHQGDSADTAWRIPFSPLPPYLLLVLYPNSPFSSLFPLPAFHAEAASVILRSCIRQMFTRRNRVARFLPPLYQEEKRLKDCIWTSQNSQTYVLNLIDGFKWEQQKFYFVQISLFILKVKKYIILYY